MKKRTAEDVGPYNGIHKPCRDRRPRRSEKRMVIVNKGGRGDPPYNVNKE